MTDVDVAYKLAVEMFRARGSQDAEYIDERIAREGYASYVCAAYSA